MSPHRVRGGVSGVMKGSLAKKTAAKTNGRRQETESAKRLIEEITGRKRVTVKGVGDMSG